MLTFTTAADLQAWIADHMGETCTDEIAEAVTDEIRTDRDLPAWGADWTTYMDATDLWQMANEMADEWRQEQERIATLPQWARDIIVALARGESRVDLREASKSYALANTNLDDNDAVLLRGPMWAQVATEWAEMLAACKVALAAFDSARETGKSTWSDADVDTMRAAVGKAEGR